MPYSPASAAALAVSAQENELLPIFDVPIPQKNMAGLTGFQEKHMCMRERKERKEQTKVGGVRNIGGGGRMMGARVYKRPCLQNYFSIRWQQ